MGEINSREHMDINQPEIGSPEQAKRYLDIANNHSNKSRTYERQANTLESQIQKKLQPEKRMNEVCSLRKQAEREKKEAEKYKSYAEVELRKPIYGEAENEFGEQIERNKSELLKINVDNVENQDTEIVSVDEALQNSENVVKSIIREMAGVSSSELAKKFELSKEEKNTISEVDSMFNGEISFKGIKGYKKGACSGREIPIYD